MAGQHLGDRFSTGKSREAGGWRGAVTDGTVVPYVKNVQTYKHRSGAQGEGQDKDGIGAAVADAQAKTRTGGSVRWPGFYVRHVSETGFGSELAGAFPTCGLV